jgi:hypothetical protein
MLPFFGFHRRKITLTSGFPVLRAPHVRHRNHLLLRAVLDQGCESVSHREIGARTHVASKILKAVTMGEVSAEVLRQVGRDALSAPTMWR